jgi:hypothetical protein
MISLWVEKCLHIFSFRNKLLGHINMLLAILFGTGHDISCIWVIVVVVVAILQQTYREITHKMVMKIFKILWKNGCQQLSFGPIFCIGSETWILVTQNATYFWRSTKHVPMWCSYVCVNPIEVMILQAVNVHSLLNTRNVVQYVCHVIFTML